MTDAQGDEAQREQGTNLSRKEMAHSNRVIRGEVEQRGYLQRVEGNHRDKCKASDIGALAPLRTGGGQRGGHHTLETGKGHLTGAVTLVSGGKNVCARQPCREGLGTKSPDRPLLPTPPILLVAPTRSQSQESPVIYPNRAASWGVEKGERIQQADRSCGHRAR